MPDAMPLMAPLIEVMNGVDSRLEKSSSRVRRVSSASVAETLAL